VPSQFFDDPETDDRLLGGMVKNMQAENRPAPSADPRRRSGFDDLLALSNLVTKDARGRRILSQVATAARRQL
jgi:hypothetical protein